MPRDFSRRSLESEIMDGGAGAFAVFDESLRQIEFINRLTLGYRPILAWLDRHITAQSSRALTILDVGSGRGELLRQVWRSARKKRAPVQLTGIDIDAWSATAARQATPEYMSITYKAADIFDAEVTADFIVCSHTAHHMDDDTLVRFILWMEAHAGRGWFICDLHRHPAAYLLAKLILRFAPVNSMVRNDGAVSVARAFTAADWSRILERAGVSAGISWHFPFRYGIARMKQP